MIRALTFSLIAMLCAGTAGAVAGAPGSTAGVASAVSGVDGGLPSVETPSRVTAGAEVFGAEVSGDTDTTQSATAIASAPLTSPVMRLSTKRP